jgi:capsular polysaccharide biosynthesis protein
MSALRRRWRLLIAIPLATALLGIAYLVTVPAASQASATYILVQPPNTDPATGMATDVSFLQTRAVASDVVESLDLPMTPEDFGKSFVATPVTSNVLYVVLSAPDDAAAVERLSALTEAFLGFRTAQLQGQTKALTDGYQEQIDALSERVEALTKQYNSLDDAPVESAAAATANEVLVQRAQAQSEIEALQRKIEDANLTTQALVVASHVLDEPSVVPRSPLRRTVLVVASAVIGGVALGVGFVVVTALASSTLRRREDVARALDAPVRASVGRVRSHRVRRLLTRADRAKHNRDLIVHYLADHVAGPDAPSHVLLGCVGDPRAVRGIVLGAADRLAAAGVETLVVDLSRSGSIAKGKAPKPTSEHGPGRSGLPTTLRPEGIAGLARGPLLPDGRGRGARAPAGDPRYPAWERASVTLTVVDLDPSMPMDTLPTWGTELVVIVEAGRATAEMLASSAALVARAGVDLSFALMFDADATDESYGFVGDEDPAAATDAGKASG